jgi:hypothetical protein
VALPPPVVRYLQAIVNVVIALFVALILVVAILPAVASSQISSADQAIATAITHQSKVDAGFASLLAPDPSTNDLNVIQAQAVKGAQSVNSALAIVRADKNAIDGANLRLMILGWFSPRSRSATARERVRLAVAHDGLSQADVAFTAGANQAKVRLPVYDAMIDFAKMYTAMGKHDLTGVGALYRDAHQKVALAMSLEHAPGVPDALTQEVSAFNDLLNNFESLAQAIQGNDAAGIKKYSDAVQAGLKTMLTLSKAVPANYQFKSYGGMQKSFDAAMMTLKSASSAQH